MKKTDVSAQTKWSIDRTHSEISFKVKHLMISHVKGTFARFDANIYTYLKDFTTANIDLWIDVSSVTTGDDKRDEHLKSADFFDVQNHQLISFITNNIERSDTALDHELWGELTIKGVTKNIKLNVEFGGMITDPWGNERAGFTVAGKIKRSEWGLVWNTVLETGGLMVSDDVTISCDIELIKVDYNKLTMEAESLN